MVLKMMRTTQCSLQRVLISITPRSAAQTFAHAMAARTKRGGMALPFDRMRREHARHVGHEDRFNRINGRAGRHGC